MFTLREGPPSSRGPGDQNVNDLDEIWYACYWSGGGGRDAVSIDQLAPFFFLDTLMENINHGERQRDVHAKKEAAFHFGRFARAWAKSSMHPTKY